MSQMDIGNVIKPKSLKKPKSAISQAESIIK